MRNRFFFLPFNNVAQKRRLGNVLWLIFGITVFCSANIHWAQKSLCEICETATIVLLFKKQTEMTSFQCCGQSATEESNTFSDRQYELQFPFFFERVGKKAPMQCTVPRATGGRGREHRGSLNMF